MKKLNEGEKQKTEIHAQGIQIGISQQCLK